MSSELITEQVPSVPAKEPENMVPPPPPRTASKGAVYRALTALASLRLTVALFTLAILIVFLGTLAQVDEGIWTVLHKYFRAYVAWIPFQALVRFGQVFLGLPKDMYVSGSFPFPGGWTIGALMMANLSAAYITRFPFTWKRSGILLLHAGLMVLMLGEFITGQYAVEARMTIRNGGSANYLEETERLELAVIDSSDPKNDDVIVVPHKLLQKIGSTIHNDLLPFDVEPKVWMPNSAEPRAPEKGTENLATAGDGLQKVARQVPQVSGTDTEQKIDIPSAYVTLKDKTTGQPLGTYLVSLWFSVLDDPSQTVTVGGKTYELSLRFRRTYTPYTVTLKEFRHDKYPGTEIPKNYSSLVTLDDPSRNEKRDVKIYMNNPLRYEGETFYQSGVLPGDSGTILQVVRNPGWTLPYVACVMVALGMIVHFGIRLNGFLHSFKLGEVAVPVNSVQRFLPWGAFAVGCLTLAVLAAPAQEHDNEMNLEEFGKLPVLDRGRIKPIDTVARNALLVISNRQDFRDDKGKTHPATAWLLDVMTSNRLFKMANEKKAVYPIQGEKDKVFRIENDQVLALLGLEMRPGSYRYSLEEILPKSHEFDVQAERARKLDAKEQTLFDAKVIDLAQHLQTYFELAEWQSPRLVPPRKSAEQWFFKMQGPADAVQDQAPAFEEFVQSIRASGKAGEPVQWTLPEGWKSLPLKEEEKSIFGGGTRHARIVINGKGHPLLLDVTSFPNQVGDVRANIDRWRGQIGLSAVSGPAEVAQATRDVTVDGIKATLADMTGPGVTGNGKVRLLAAIVPLPDHNWQPLGTAVRDMLINKQPNEAAQAFIGILGAYAEGNAAEFNKEVANYRKAVADVATEEINTARFEAFFNAFEPFSICWTTYCLAVLLAVVSWIVLACGSRSWFGAMNRTAFWMILLALMVHTWGLVARMYIQGRPPVTNLYSSAVFIGWGVVLMGLVLERFFPMGIFNAVAGVLGFSTALIAHHLAHGGDTMEMLQAVLDTNFWLATHVTCITLGYAATFLAGTIGIAYLMIRAFMPQVLDQDILKANYPLSKVLSQVLYAVICFATLLSFTGTVLGGIWADQSWGRFWGWDPKENGALIIVLMNALILHARWSGLVKQRGIAVLAVVGNMVTGWSWFGTNQLGVGLHAYGFNNTLAMGLTVGWAVHLGIIAIALIPRRAWRWLSLLPFPNGGG